MSNRCLTSEKNSPSSSPLSAGFYLHLCFCAMFLFAGGPSKSGSAPPPPVYPAAHPLPNSAAALPLSQQVMWWKPAFSLSLRVFLTATAYLRSASVLAYCLLLLLELWLLPEQPNKPVIRRRAVCKCSCSQPKHCPGFYGRTEVL